MKGSYVARCVVCGVRRVETCYGWQRNPGQCDRRVYKTGNASPMEAKAEMQRQRRNRRRRAARRAKAAVSG